MASRTAQKQAARERRLAQERESALKARRTRRLQMLGGVIAAAIIVVVVLIIVSPGGGSSAPKPNSSGARTAASNVTNLLSGIPQSGATLGNPHAKVTVTEYGDLECPICADFAKKAEHQLISNEVHAGKVKLVYKSFPTATANGPEPNIFARQQSAAYAAGDQGKAWNYILTFYHEQGQEGTSYVNTSFLNGIAKQVPGLNFTKWSSQVGSPGLEGRVTKEQTTATGLGVQATPAIIVSGPKSQTKPSQQLLSYNQLQSMIKSVQ